MLPTLFGRIQTRIFLLAIVGGFWTFVLAPFLPFGEGIGTRWRVGFTVLATVCVLGIIWEFIYHGLMQFRWEKDWPTLFGFATFINEGLVVWVLLLLGVVPGIEAIGVASGATVGFWIQFMVVWIAVWLTANGPMRVPFIRWRFFGGRLL